MFRYSLCFWPIHSILKVISLSTVIRFYNTKLIEDSASMNTIYHQPSLPLQRQQQINRFKGQFESVCPNYAYELLLLEAKVADEQSKQKPSIEQITRLIELYMLAVEVLESTADQKFHYFNRKIQSLMMKKNIVELLHMASTGKRPSVNTLSEANKAEMGVKKQEHQMQMYYHSGQVDIKKIQEILKKSDIQVSSFEGKIRNNLTSQEKRLQERIKERKLRSQSGSVKGSVTKFRIPKDSNKDTPPNKNIVNVHQRDIRMEYFVDCNDKQFDKSIKTPPKKRESGSVEKFIQGTKQKFGFSNRFI